VDPPSLGGVNDTFACPFETVAVPIIGAPGTVVEGVGGAGGASVTFPKLAIRSVSIRLEAGFEKEPDPPTRVV
jgi:hypothetical protein